MEKFTKFRDAGTGIAPFLPIAPGSRTPFIFLLELTLCVFRIPLIFLVFGLEVILVEGVGELFMRKIWPEFHSWVRWLFLRMVLLLCGIWRIDEHLDGVSKS
jgi:1-acylglycerol-3-phosphate O-acyltransferase